MVKSPFETASRAALEEILTSHMQTSKYGYFIARPRPNVSAKSIEAFVEWLKQND